MSSNPGIGACRLIPRADRAAIPARLQRACSKSVHVAAPSGGGAAWRSAGIRLAFRSATARWSDQMTASAFSSVSTAGRSASPAARPLYERHLTFDRVMSLDRATPRDRFEAIARSIRGVLSQRWLRTEQTHRERHVKRVYCASLELPRFGDRCSADELGKRVA
jgi:hypothetical protein